jgi:superfamily II DNA or RNA helicase
MKTLDIDCLFSRPPWDHQREGVQQTIDALTNGTNSVCLTAPTGAGKTACEIALTKHWAEECGLRVLCLTNRILLTQQTREVFQTDKVHAGVISASMPQFEREDSRIQIATIQTILARRRKQESYWVDADLVLADEVHQMATGESAELLNEYVARGAKVCGVTATPLGVSNVCDELIVAARTRDLQDEGILCYASWFAPSELDTRKLVKGKVDLSLTENDARRTWGPLKGDDKKRTRIVGKLLDHYKSLHPTQIHTLAFAPGVKESLWAAQFCRSRGIRALHVDGDDFWVDGKLYDRKEDEQKFCDAMDEWRNGDIPILWNRFVLREGIDEPQIQCLMLATPIGSYRSFIQMVGRGLRRHPDKDHVKVLDFGGSWWRHGSVNININWESFYYYDAEMISKQRVTHYRETGEAIGFGCPNCGMVHSALCKFTVCKHCGHELRRGKVSRPILQQDGTLTHVNGEPISQWKIRRTPECEKIWEGLYWNAIRNLKKDAKPISFNQLYQQFYMSTAIKAGSRSQPAYWKAYHPPRDLPLMPKVPFDWHAHVGDLRQDELYQGCEG